MERVKSLRQEAKALREIAERCKEHPVFYRQMLELAQRCDDMANNLGEALGSRSLRHP